MACRLLPRHLQARAPALLGQAKGLQRGIRLQRRRSLNRNRRPPSSLPCLSIHAAAATSSPGRPPARQPAYPSVYPAGQPLPGPLSFRPRVRPSPTHPSLNLSTSTHPSTRLPARRPHTIRPFICRSLNHHRCARPLPSARPPVHPSLELSSGTQPSAVRPPSRLAGENAAASAEATGTQGAEDAAAQHGTSHPPPRPTTPPCPGIVRLPVCANPRLT